MRIEGGTAKLVPAGAGSWGRLSCPHYSVATRAPEIFLKELKFLSRLDCGSRCASETAVSRVEWAPTPRAAALCALVRELAEFRRDWGPWNQFGGATSWEAIDSGFVLGQGYRHGFSMTR